MQFAELFDLYLRVVYDRDTLTRGFVEFLAPYRNKPLLDCACGTGFLILDLIKLGFPIACNDGSRKMLKIFERAAKEMGVNITPTCYHWNELAAHFQAKFSLLLCRGNSLIYCNTWDEAAAKIASNSDIAQVFDNFYQCLSPDGALYLDVPVDIHGVSGGTRKRRYPPKTIDGHTIKVEEEVRSVPDSLARLWQVTIECDGESRTFERNSRHLTETEFRNLLKAAGFGRIESVKITGERENCFSLLAYK